MSGGIEEPRFSFERARGVVWVCDIEDSSKFLNDNDSAHAMEEYLPRLNWLGRIAIGAANGNFIKWTGDGFLGWFPIALQRDLGSQAEKVLQAIWHLTLMNNVTSLGVGTDVKFRLRHGLTMEHDALLTTVSDSQGSSLDLIGRSVVLAFRLAGMRASFPNITTQREIVEACRENDGALVEFKKINLSSKDRMKYFKGEQFGTRNLYGSTERKHRVRSEASAVRMVRNTISKAENPTDDTAGLDTTTRNIVRQLEKGPQWSRDVLSSHLRFVREDLLGALKRVASALEGAQEG